MMIQSPTTKSLKSAGHVFRSPWYHDVSLLNVKFDCRAALDRMTVCLKVNRGRSIRGYRDGGRVRVEGDRRRSGRRDYGAFIYARIIRVAGKGYRVLVVTGIRCEP